VGLFRPVMGQLLYVRGVKLTRPTIGFESYGQPHIISAKVNEILKVKVIPNII
jgi:hypothetical protein